MQTGATPLPRGARHRVLERLNQQRHPGPSCSNGIVRAAVSLCRACREIPRYSAACELGSQLSGRGLA